MIVEGLNFIKPLGQGSFGEVFLTSKMGTTELFATKKIDRKYADSPEVRKYFVNEINILKEVKHDNIVKLNELKQTNDYYYIVMEYCNGGSLTDCLDKYKKIYNRPFSEKIVQYLMRQIVDAIKYLHNKKIIHRDLKLDNILVKFDNELDKNQLNMMKAKVKIIDFGFAIHLNSKNMAYSALGSPINMDPTRLKKMNKRGGNNTNSLGYDEKADIWSLGTICYEMLIGQPLFNADSMGDLVKKVEQGSYTVPTSLSREVVSFLNGMLQYDSKSRFSANDLSKHHFLTKDTSQFSPIDLGKVSNKVNRKGLNINTIKNSSIWSVFNENEEELKNVPQNLNRGNTNIRNIQRANVDIKKNTQEFPNNPFTYQYYTPPMVGGMQGMNPQFGQMNTMMVTDPMGRQAINPFITGGAIYPYNNQFQNRYPSVNFSEDKFRECCKIF